MNMSRSIYISGLNMRFYYANIGLYAIKKSKLFIDISLYYDKIIS